MNMGTKQRRREQVLREEDGPQMEKEQGRFDCGGGGREPGRERARPDAAHERAAAKRRRGDHRPRYGRLVHWGRAHGPHSN